MEKNQRQPDPRTWDHIMVSEFECPACGKNGFYCNCPEDIMQGVCVK